jgi:general secretion pathway protein L
MSVLVILIEPRRRGVTPSAPGAAGVPAEFNWVLSADGTGVVRQGRSPAGALPRADSVVAALPDEDVAWHRLAIPKAPAARLRAALGGLLEEAVLEDVELLHFALAPDLGSGQTGWVASTHHGWLGATLAELEKAGTPVDRVVPLSAPATPAEGHFLPAAGHDEALPRLVLCHPDGVACLTLAGGLAKALVSRIDMTGVRWTSHPAATAAGERWVGTAVTVTTDAERALRSARSAWNLRQFDLLPRHRGTLALRDLWWRFFSRAWRPVRWGLVGLVALQLVGLNAWAWRQERSLDDRRKAMNALLQAAHPQVRAVLDAPLQMQRETESLRAAAGKPGETDLEALLGAAAAAWPDGQGPVQTLRFEPGRLTLAAPAWTPQQLAQFQERLRPAGLGAELAEGRVTLTRVASARSAG